MHCSSCAQKIEKTLNELPGIESALINLATRRAKVVGKIPTEKIFTVIREIGYFPEFTDNSTQEIEKLWNQFWLATAFSVPISILAMTTQSTPFTEWLQLLLVIPVVWSGQSFFMTALRLAKRFSANMDSLVTIGTGAALIFSTYSLIKQSHTLYFEGAAVIITLVLLGRCLEGQAKGRAALAIRRLMTLAPSHTLRIKNNQEEEIEVSSIALGDHLVLRPGDSIPVDGTVIEGHSTVNEAMLTGESMPLPKKAGDFLWAATINIDGRLIMKAEKIGADTVLQKIIHLVDSAQSSKAPIQRMADVVSERFVPGVLGVAGATFIFWLMLGSGLETALLSAIAVLVVACPCALGLATPTAILVGTGRGAELGILIRNAESLELAQKINVLIFDKTGTLTEGRPEVTEILEIDPSKTEEHLALAMTLEGASEHPLAKAIVNYCKGEGATLKKIENFRAAIGEGVEATIEGKNVKLGNDRFSSIEVLNPTQAAQIERLRTQGKSVVYLVVEGKLSLVFAISDPIRPQALVALSHIRQLEIHTIMATGDNKTTAYEVAQELGIDEVVAPCLPHEKAELVRKLQSQGQIVGMVGDGINDAPALAQADVSFALGSGTDVALETASIALLKGDIGRVGLAIELSNSTIRIIRQNLFWAFIYNLIAIPFAALGLLNPMVAAGAMAFSSISVVTNSLRLKRIGLR